MLLFRKYHFIIISIIFLIITACNVDAARVTGYVFDANGNPIYNVDLDYIDPATGLKLVYSNPNYNDNTNILGAYQSPFLLAGVYHLSYDPPDSTHFVGKKILNLDLTSYGLFDEIILPDVYLDSGIVIMGTVKDTNGVPVERVNINVDSLLGGRVYTSNDKTKLFTGAYWIVVPPGNYRLRYKSPPGSSLRGHQIDSVTITGDTIINVTLSSGTLLSGQVTDEFGDSLFNIDVDLRTSAAGQKIYISDNSTDSAGYYNVAVPTGMFSLRFSPPWGSNIVSELIDSFQISSDRTWNQVLKRGVTFTAVVHDSLGNPVQDVNLNFNLESSGIKVFTPNDKTRTDGISIVSLLPDIYTIKLKPPIGTSFDQLVVTGVPILNDTIVNFLLPEAQRINFSGSVIDQTGLGLADIQIILRNLITGTRAYIINNITDLSGSFNIAVPKGTYDVFFSPPLGSRYVGYKVNNISFNLDTLWSPVTMKTGLFFTANVVDKLNSPVQDVDFDFISESTGLGVFTPDDNTDVDGHVQVAVLPDMYTIILNQPLGSDFLSLTINNMDIQTDTTITFKLARSSESTSPNDFILRQNYPNPFNSTTSIQYEILSNGNVSINIYNTLGQLVKVLKDEYLLVNSYQTTWDGTNQRGEKIASGIYFCQLKTPQGEETRLMVLIR